VTIRRRAGLSSLLADVVSRTASFKAILVYDVSRWGRFQDADESAHYEFLCRRAGISMIYCAEQFAGDTTPLGSVLKSLKRAMAGEFSRELGVKVSAGKARIGKMGFRIWRPHYASASGRKQSSHSISPLMFKMIGQILGSSRTRPN
jgi:DNA invertase Pin-like site-specific DNA recombinase